MGSYGRKIISLPQPFRLLPESEVLESYEISTGIATIYFYYNLPYIKKTEWIMLAIQSIIN
jgi:hypothetical protein